MEVIFNNPAVDVFAADVGICFGEDFGGEDALRVGEGGGAHEAKV